jgi:ParB family transcriptional regulator, chromosome partitioning protein
MNAITKTIITIERHCLQLPYASLRLQKRQWLDKLVMSMESVGQLVPVVAVPKDINQWILIDGHLRVNALQRIGKDVVAAEVWNCDVRDALVMLLTTHQSRSKEAIEEALLLHELQTQHGLSQSCLAAKLGRDQSWVSRRLLLLEQLPESVLHAVTLGKLSVWIAVRVLAPMARAIPEHATLLLQHVLKEPRSTRELKGFYDHYQQATHSQRDKMVNNPDLFFKAQKLLMLEKKSNLLQAGLEGKWCSQLRATRQALASLMPIAPKLFSSYQDSQVRTELINALTDTQKQWALFIQTTWNFTDAHERHAADNY